MSAEKEIVKMITDQSEVQLSVGGQVIDSDISA